MIWGDDVCRPLVHSAHAEESDLPKDGALSQRAKDRVAVHPTQDLNLPRLYDEHFVSDVVLPADGVAREINDGSEQDDEVLEQAGLAVAEQLHLDQGVVVDAHGDVSAHLKRRRKNKEDF